jgi:hypothetical protein
MGSFSVIAVSWDDRHKMDAQVTVAQSLDKWTSEQPQAVQVSRSREWLDSG